MICHLMKQEIKLISDIEMCNALEANCDGYFRGGTYLFVDCRFGHYFGCRL